MVELSIGQVCWLMGGAFAVGVVWQMTLRRVLAGIDAMAAKKPNSKGWKACVTDSGLEAKIIWTSHASWGGE